MNTTCENSSTDENSFSFSACNNTEVDDDLTVSVTKSMAYILTVLLSFPTNSYVIWLIVTGTGNGLAAEIFNLNFSVSESFYCIECLLATLCEIETVNRVMDFLEGLPMTGRPLFQCLICVERYLAVVYPVTFLKYKPLRYRLMCCAVAWIICFCSCTFNVTTAIYSSKQLKAYFISYFAQFFLFLSIQLFCCLAVLRALKQSGPGEREREEENHMKRRAFNLILITTVTMVIIYAPQITLDSFVWTTNEEEGILGSFSYVCFLFSGLVQPLLFLYRVGKPNFIKCR